MRVLSVTHGPSVPGGVFDEVAEAAGHELERWVVPLGGAPQPARATARSWSSAARCTRTRTSGTPGSSARSRSCATRSRDDVPVVGVCLGAQMLARAADAWVGPAPEPEIGWFDVELTAEGRDDPVLGVLPSPTEAFQWHSYTFGVPETGTELARSAVCTQAFRAGMRAWGVQFHAEVTLAMVRAWTAEEADELPVPVEEFLAETERRIDEWNGHGRRLAAAFLATADELGHLLSTSAGSDGSADHSCHDPT